jgi:hypothetical protein
VSSFVPLLLLLSGNAFPGRAGEVKPEASAGVISGDGFEMAIGAREIAARILDDGKRGDAAALSKAQLTAARVLEAAGDEAAARSLRKTVLSESREPDSRAEAAFVLGFAAFLRERPDLAAGYWKYLPRLAPDSPWTRRAERFRPYLEIVPGVDPKTGEARPRPLPPLEGRFSLPGGPETTIRLEDLRGRYTVLHFWSSAQGRDAIARDVERAGKLLSSFRSRSGLDVRALGVNLDADKEPFEAAMREARISWPQHRDGAGFEGPLVRALGIPCLPRFLLIDPEVRSCHVGGAVLGKRSLETALGSAAGR